jgi:hypothetical protein
MHRTPAVSTASTLFCVLSTVHNKLSATDRSGNAGAADPEYHQVGRETQKQWWDGHPDYQKQRRQQNPVLVENNRRRPRGRDQKRRVERLVRNNLASAQVLILPLVGH